MLNPDRGDRVILFSVQEDNENQQEVDDRVQRFVHNLESEKVHLKLNMGGVDYSVITKKESTTKKQIAKAILETASKENVDYLIMGSRASSLTKYVLGSVSNYVIEHSKIPVLITPHVEDK
jgi:nucleotide-binding universal stress UspA family protein